MRCQVIAARRENAPILEEASNLLQRKQELEAKKQLLNAFNDYFIVSEDEVLVLTTSAEGVDEQFFNILKRMKKIHGDCQILLGGEDQRLGTELMEQCSRNLNLGYQKLYRWIQKELKNLNLEHPQINSMIRRALRALSERPTLFQGCLDFFAEARERVLTDAFYSALTGASSAAEQDNLMKPIEFHAHEPLRYVGDMLAWTHSVTVSEREALENLFISEAEEFKKGFQAGKVADPWSTGESEGFDGQKALGDLVNRDVVGVAKALRQRIEQVLQNHEDPVLLYKLMNLINFYRVTFSKLLGSESSLIETLEILEESALRHFRTITKETISSVKSDLAAPSASLAIPEFFKECLMQFSELLKSFDATLTPASSRTETFQPIVDVALDPFMAACESMSEKVDAPDSRVFLTNCLLAAQRTLSTHSFVQERLSSLTQRLGDCTSNLAEYQHAYFLHTSGLHPLLAALASIDNDASSSAAADDGTLFATKAPNLPALQPLALADASQTLDEFLPSALMDAMENLKHLDGKAVAQEITAEAAERFCEDFEYVEAKLLAIDEFRMTKKAATTQEGNNGNGNKGDEEEDEHEEGDGAGAEGMGRGRNGSNAAAGGDNVAAVVFLKSLFPRTSGEIRVLLS